ncbi:764_t:CDS:1, partial [Gigaspora margarita]
PIIFSTQFLGRYSSLSHINLHANLIDLICSAAIKHPLTMPQPLLININNEIVSNIFHPNQATTTLQQIALNNAV